MKVDRDLKSGEKSNGELSRDSRRQKAPHHSKVMDFQCLENFSEHDSGLHATGFLPCGRLQVHDAFPKTGLFGESEILQI